MTAVLHRCVSRGTCLRVQGVGQRLTTLEAVRLPALEAKVTDTSTADLLESLRSCARSPLGCCPSKFPGSI